MQLFEKYQLFLFDFDGLLVNTEKLHYVAYQKMCKTFGFNLDWSLKDYCKSALLEATGPKSLIHNMFPPLATLPWEELRATKTAFYLQALQEDEIELMPGVSLLLEMLEKQKIKSVVVTNSPLEHVEMICKKQPILRLIPFWITREGYREAKPHPESYQKAIALYGKQGEKAIGFEDSPRGLQALLGAPCDAVMISSFFNRKEIDEFVKGKFSHYSSFSELLEGSPSI